MNRYFTNPENTFSYVKDSILWNEIFKQPFFTENGRQEEIMLSHYFEVEKYSHGELGFRNLISVTKKYCRTDVKTADIALSALSEFLIRYNRPFTECYIAVPNHETIEERKEFRPADICYSVPQYPCLERNKLRFTFDKDLYKELYLYIFGIKLDAVGMLQSPDLLFSSKCFCGFMLHY